MFVATKSFKHTFLNCLWLQKRKIDHGEGAGGGTAGKGAEKGMIWTGPSRKQSRGEMKKLTAVTDNWRVVKNLGTDEVNQITNRQA